MTSIPGFTANPDIPGTGNALASFLLGVPSQTSVTVTTATYAFLHNYGFFVEDTFQATPKLTITAGLRWEQPGAYSEEHNIDAVFLPNVASDHWRRQFLHQSAWRERTAKGHGGVVGFTALSVSKRRVAPLEDILPARWIRLSR